MKHPLWHLDAPEWHLHMQKAQKSFDADSIWLVGYVIAWFAAVEIQLTHRLFALSEAKSLERFHTLTKGMDSRVKLERFRQLCKDAELEIGPNLKARLSWFEEAEVPFRNTLAHSFIVTSKEGGEIQLCNIAAWPETTGQAVKKGSKRPERISHDVLLAHGAWLLAFATDLKPLKLPSKPAAVLELANPRSRVPKDIPGYRDGKVSLASGNKRAPSPPQTRA
jgi:hypothetical protein